MNYCHTCVLKECLHCNKSSCVCEQDIWDNSDNSSDFICPHCGASMLHVITTSNHTEITNEHYASLGTNQL